MAGERRDLASSVAGASISAEAMITCPGVRTTLPVIFHAFRQRRVSGCQEGIGYVLEFFLFVRFILIGFVWNVRGRDDH